MREIINSEDYSILPSLTEVKNYLKINTASTAEDQLIEDLLKAGVSSLSNILNGLKILPTSVTIESDTINTNTTIKEYVLNLNEVCYYTEDNNKVIIDPINYITYLGKKGGFSFKTFAVLAPLREKYAFSYTFEAGFLELPIDLKSALLSIVATLYERRELPVMAEKKDLGSIYRNIINKYLLSY